jgi:hypothetical protein
MQNTKLMLAAVGTFLITWALLGLIGYLLSDSISYKECMTDEVTIFVMVVFGWIPSTLVCIDLLDKSC